MSECPICFEVMENDNNKIKTECGHEFHSNCFLTNVAHNGFNCPCCRKELAQNPCSCDMYDSDEEDEDEEDEDEDDEDEEDDFIEPPLYYVLNKLKDQYTKKDLLKIIINYYNEHTIEEYLDIDEKMFDNYTKIMRTFNALTKEEREIELMTMEDKNCNEKEEIKLIDDFNTIIDMRVY